LERTAGLEPSRASSKADRSEHIAALEAALLESREAHASTLRDAREREMSLEAHVFEQAAALRGQAVQLDAISRSSRFELEQTERRAAAERRTLALEMRSVEEVALALPDRLAGLRAALERRLLARELRGLELRPPLVSEVDVDFEAASAEAIRCVEAAFASLRRKDEDAEADQQEQAETEWQRTRTVELASALFRMAAAGGGGREGDQVPWHGARGGRAAHQSTSAGGWAAADASADADIEDTVETARAAYARSRAGATDAATGACAHARSRDGTEGVVRGNPPAAAASRHALEPLPHDPDAGLQLHRHRLKQEEIKCRQLRQILREAEMLKRAPREATSPPASRTNGDTERDDEDQQVTEATQAVTSAATAWGSPRRPSPASVPQPTKREPASFRDATQPTRAHSPPRPLPVRPPASRCSPHRQASPVRKTARRSFPAPPQPTHPAAEPSPPKEQSAPSLPRYLVPAAASLSRSASAQSPTGMHRPSTRPSPGPSPTRQDPNQSPNRKPSDWGDSKPIPSKHAHAAQGPPRAPATAAGSSMEGPTLLLRVLEQQKRLLKDLDSSRHRREQNQRHPPSPARLKQGSAPKRSVAAAPAASPRRASFRDPPAPVARPKAAAQGARRSESAGRTRPLPTATCEAAARSAASKPAGRRAATGAWVP
jgi:hypothetical protein